MTLSRLTNRSSWSDFRNVATFESETLSNFRLDFNLIWKLHRLERNYDRWNIKWLASQTVVILPSGQSNGKFHFNLEFNPGNQFQILLLRSKLNSKWTLVQWKCSVLSNEFSSNFLQFFLLVKMIYRNLRSCTIIYWNIIQKKMYVLPLLFDKSDVSIKDLRLTIVYHLTKIFSVQIFTENNFTKRHNTENFSLQKSTFL